MGRASFPHLSTDQVAAFVELSRHGHLRGAAAALNITEQGLRSRLITLEAQLGLELYRKRRGPRRGTLLTEQGQRFLPHALAFLERADELWRALELDAGPREIHIAASQYLIRYVLIDLLRDFRHEAPDVHVRVSSMSEQDVESALMSDATVAFGLAAAYEPSPDLDYRELFALPWSIICPRRHPMASKSRPRLKDVAVQPLILYERGSTGRQHVLDAFHEAGLTPRVVLETTSTETIVSMVEAGLGVSIVPLLPSGAVTRGRRVDARPLGQDIRPIHSGVLLRRGANLAGPSARLLSFIEARFS